MMNRRRKKNHDSRRRVDLTLRKIFSSEEYLARREAILKNVSRRIVIVFSGQSIGKTRCFDEAIALATAPFWKIKPVDDSIDLK